jgi:KaiC/GvpD/RAD55 family RecA-like ATPase
VTSLRRFYIRTSEEYLALQSFFRLLSDMGITAVLTVQLPEVSKPDAESLMARGEVRLHKWFDGKGLARGVTIEKFRGSSHDATMRPLRLTAEGVSVRLAAPKKRGEAKKTEPAEQAPVPDGSQEATPDDTKARAEPTQASPPPQET